MCGICGRYNLNPGRHIDANMLGAMTDVLEHRGPDDSGIFIEKNVGFGHRRLSILDLSPLGHQPMFNEDKSVSVVFNGEIYNYKDIKADLEAKGHAFRSATDTEVIVHAYEEYGPDCVNLFNGMFAIAIWDAKKRELMLVRDRLGIKPLYYYQNRDFISFASEIKSILIDHEVPREVDTQALSNFLTLHYVPGPRTMFRNIMKLQPGHMLIVSNGKSRIKRYWELKKNQPVVDEMERISENEAADRVYAALKESVKKRLQSDVPVGALLSGGLDSTAILGLMTELTGKNVPSFTVGYSEKGDDSASEFKYSRFAAKHFKSDYHEVVVTADTFRDFLPKAIWHQDEPIGEPPSIPLYYVSKLAKDHGVTVILTGEGSDELFAGYNRHWGEILSRYYLLMPEFLRESLLKRLIHMIPRAPLLKKGHRSMSIENFKERFMSWHTVFTDDHKSDLLRTTDFMNSTFADVYEKYYHRIGNLHNLDKILLLDINVWLPDDLLMKKDKMGMATSIEARVPFLDYTFVELAYQMPARMKVKRLATKYILKKAMERLIPKEIIYRKKEGFPTPISDWIKNELRDFTLDTLCSRSSLSHGLFDRDEVTKLVFDHVKGKEDNSRLIFPLLNFELWHNIFFKEHLYSQTKVHSGIIQKP